MNPTVKNVPLLPYDHIKSFINENWQLDVSIEDLQKPNIDRIFHIFDNFLKDFQVQTDLFRQPLISIPHSFEHNDLCDQTIPILHFFSSLKVLLEKAGLPDFTLDDLFNPNRKRTRRIFCYLINFWRFYTAKEYEFKKVITRFSAIRDQILVKEREVDMLKQDMNKLSYALAQHEQEGREDRELLEHLHSDVDKCQTKAANYQRTKESLRFQNSQWENEIAALDIFLSEKSKQLQELQSKFIRSPNRLISEHNEMKKKLEKILSNKEEIQRKMQVYNKERDIAKYSAAGAEFAEKLEDLSATSKVFIENKDKCEQLLKAKEVILKENADLEEKKKEGGKLYKFNEDGYMKFRANFNKRSKVLESAFEETKCELITAKKRCNNNISENEAMENVKISLQKKIATIEKKKEKAEEGFNLEFEMFVNQLQDCGLKLDNESDQLILKLEEGLEFFKES